LIADMTSDLFSRPIDVSRFGLLYASAQKNFGTAGLTVVVIRKDLLDRERSAAPAILRYSTHAAAGSLYNTPPVFPVYVAHLVLRRIEKLGGLTAVDALNREKAALLYEFLEDASGVYVVPVDPRSRSLMNIVFQLRDPTLAPELMKEATQAGLLG